MSRVYKKMNVWLEELKGCVSGVKVKKWVTGCVEVVQRSGEMDGGVH